MILTTEIAIIASTIIGALSLCFVKAASQIRKSRCTHIEMCCISCDRELLSTEEISKEERKEEDI